MNSMRVFSPIPRSLAEMTGWDLKDQQKVVHKLRRVGCVHPRPLQAWDGMCQNSASHWRWYRYNSCVTCFFLFFQWNRKLWPLCSCRWRSRMGPWTQALAGTNFFHSTARQWQSWKAPCFLSWEVQLHRGVVRIWHWWKPMDAFHDVSCPGSGWADAYAASHTLG